nr:MAG TPA: hypothetical protein [Caudoviricetes sp.]
MAYIGSTWFTGGAESGSGSGFEPLLYYVV